VEFDIEEVKLRLSEEGYCVFPEVLEAAEAKRLEDICRERMEAMGDQYISLEGALNAVPELAPLCTHPIVMGVAEAVLGPGFILANSMAVKWCKPGTKSGGLHADWPIPATARTDADSKTPPWGGLQTFWMLSDGTAENGATVIVPFSHHTNRGPQHRSYPSEMPVVGKRGSLFVYHNALWHQTGANTTTDQHRVFANAFYIPGSIHRSPGSWPLVKREIFQTFQPELQGVLVRSVEEAAQ